MAGLAFKAYAAETVPMSLPRFCLTAVALALAAAVPISASADFGPPKKKVDCRKPENKNKPACKPKAGISSDDEIYNAAYWMARQGQYAQALSVLKGARDAGDPRILNATGYATRKLGQVDAAMTFYHRALARDPDYVLARAYLGEAYLMKNSVAEAEGQLAEIARRCGTACEAYASLSRHIADYRSGRRTKI